jgi:hypothetical protein
MRKHRSIVFTIAGFVAVGIALGLPTRSQASLALPSGATTADAATRLADADLTVVIPDGAAATTGDTRPVDAALAVLEVPAPVTTTLPAPVPVPTTTTTTVPTTTTTVPTTTTLAPAAAPSGGVWAELRQCESGGNYQDNTGNGYYGAYQFSLSTWEGLGLSGLPSDASPATQDAAAAELQARSGWGQWPACSARLGL